MVEEALLRERDGNKLSCFIWPDIACASVPGNFEIMVWRQRLEIASVAVTIIAILSFYAAFIRPGMPWGDDWATYIQGALNLFHGNQYGATGYIVNPDTDIGPSAYPPLYPLMLVVPIALWGVDFDAIRQFQLIGYAAFLLFAFFLVRRRLSFPLSLLVVAATGLSPYFFSFKDFLASEVLYLALLFMTFVLAARFEDRAPDGKLPTKAGVWLGVMSGLCVATRAVGLILVPTLAVYDLVRFHRIRLTTVIASIIAVAAFVLQFTLAGFLKDYIFGLMGAFGVGPAVPANVSAENAHAAAAGGNAITFLGHRIAQFVSEFSRFWGHGANGDLVARIATVVFILLAVFGYSRIRKRELMHSDVFALVYIAALLVLPPALASARMQMPLVPLFYAYVVMGVLAVRQAGGQRRWIGQTTIATTVVLGLTSYWHSYRNANFFTPLDGIEVTNYRDMFDYIQKNTDPKDAIIFDKPRTLALYTQRRTAAIYGTRKGDSLLAYMHAIGARYVLFYDDWQDGAPRETYVSDYFRNHIGDFEKLHDSGHYVLYRMKS